MSPSTPRGPCPSRTAAEWAAPGPQVPVNTFTDGKSPAEPRRTELGSNFMKDSGNSHMPWPRCRQPKHKMSYFIFNLQDRPQNNNNRLSRGREVGSASPQPCPLFLSGRERRLLPRGLLLPLRTGGSELVWTPSWASQGLCPLRTLVCPPLAGSYMPGRALVAEASLPGSQVREPYKVQERARAAIASRLVSWDPAQAPLAPPADRLRSHWHCSPPQPK